MGKTFCSFDVKLYRFENFVDFASQLRCHRQKVGLQLLVHEEKLALVLILLLLHCKDNIH